MEVVDTAKFAIGVVFAVVGAGLLWTARGSRGFGQRKQAGAMFLVAAILFVAIGLGLVDL